MGCYTQRRMIGNVFEFWLPYGGQAIRSCTKAKIVSQMLLWACVERQKNKSLHAYLLGQDKAWHNSCLHSLTRLRQWVRWTRNNISCRQIVVVGILVTYEGGNAIDEVTSRANFFRNSWNSEFLIQFFPNLGHNFEFPSSYFLFPNIQKYTDRKWNAI